MIEINDAELLRRYADEKSEAAFAELVRRHLDLVYSAALRRLGGDTHRAADVAQQVFTTLAREAKKLSDHAMLIAWLYAATRNAAIDLIRSEQRRLAREQEASTMQTLFVATPDADWAQLRPVLDHVMDELGDVDRTVVLLRFFEKRPFADIGAALDVTEDAARMRVDRALEKLRALLAHRGVTSTGAALGLALEANAVAAAPVGLTTVVIGATLAGTPTAGGMAGLIGFMSSLKLAPTIAVVAALASLGAAWFLEQENRTAAVALAAATEQNAAASARLVTLTEKASAAAKAVTVSQRALDERRSVAADGARMPKAAPAPVMTGEAFLAAHPEAQRAIDAMNAQSFELRYGPGLRALDLTPDERAHIAAELTKIMPLNSNMGGVVFALNPPSDPAPGQFDAEIFARLRTLLGEDRFQRYIEARRWEELNTLVAGVATSFDGSDTPLPPEQARAAVEILKRNSSNLGDGLNRHGIAVNWPTAAQELASLVTPAQLAALSAAHTNALGQRSLFPYRERRTPVSSSPKSSPTK